MEDRGRIVVVAAGFGLWLGGKCLASGKWSDIASLRAYKRAVPTAEPICVVVQLRDGSEVEMQEGAPGWQTFVNAAVSRLPGTPSPDEWVAEMRAVPITASERTLFARRELGT
jgi:hypothetical protein